MCQVCCLLYFLSSSHLQMPIPFYFIFRPRNNCFSPQLPSIFFSFSFLFIQTLTNLILYCIIVIFLFFLDSISRSHLSSSSSTSSIHIFSPSARKIENFCASPFVHHRTAHTRSLYLSCLMSFYLSVCEDSGLILHSNPFSKFK